MLNTFLNNIGLSNLWLNQEIVNVKWFKAVIKLKLTKTYLLVLPPNLFRPLCKFCPCYHRLPIRQVSCN